MVKKNEPEAATNIVLSFKRPIFTYAYSTESAQTAGQRMKEPNSRLGRFVSDGSNFTTIAPPEMEDRRSCEVLWNSPASQRH